MSGSGLNVILGALLGVSLTLNTTYLVTSAPCSSVTLTLNHTGRFPVSSMGHNFVLLKKDIDINEYALSAAGARNSEYIPEGDNELAYTKMLGGGESDTITFDSPEPGTYVFICSFPGHYQLMMGEFIVK